MNPSRPLPPESSPQAGEWVIVAKIVRPQGRHGEALAELLTDFPERFAERNLSSPTKKSAPRPIELERHWLHPGRIVFKFAGIETITDAGQLRLTLKSPSPRRNAPPQRRGNLHRRPHREYLIDSSTAAEVGKIVGGEYRESSATALLVIQTAAKQEALVPFAKAFHPTFDAAAKQLTMELPGGLLPG